MKNILYIVLAFLIASCEQKWEEPYEIFVLPKGKHSGPFPVQTLQSEVLRFKAIFDETAIHQAQTVENQWDSHKLMGFSDCNSLHHENSARFGWRWVNDELQIVAYCYVNKVRFIELIGTIPLNTENQFELRLQKESYDFYLNDYPAVSIPRERPCKTGIYYMLFPYFGGDEVAPHDVIIKVKIQY